MRKRIGFISNSSSCSFILKGFEIDEYNFTELKLDEVAFEEFYDFLDDNDIEYQYDDTDNVYYLGPYFSFDEGVENCTTFLESNENNETLEKITKFFPPLKKQKPQMYCGHISN
jgi:hypothetical protein